MYTRLSERLSVAGLRNSVHRIGSNRSGNVVVIFAVAMVPFLLAVGIAVDYARATSVKTTIQDAADAAALAGAALTTNSSDDRASTAKKFFSANAPNSEADVSVAVNPGKIVVTARESVPLAFGGLIGIDSMDVSALSEALISSAVKAEIALVLDYSGSMKTDSKYQAMRDSAIILVETLLKDIDEPNVSIGLVPFSDFVYSDMITTFIRGVHPDKYGVEVTACLDSRRYPYATEESTPVETVQDTKWPAPGMPKPYRQSGKLSSGLDPNDTVAPAGCEGNSTEYYGGGGDDDSDSDSDSGGSYTADRCERNHSKSEKNGQEGEVLQSDFASADAQCDEYRKRDLKVQPLTTDWKMLLDQLGNMSPLRMTNIALALEFGWHVVSPNAPFSEGGDYSDGEAFKAIVLLSDGNQTVGGFGPGSSFNVAQADKNTAELCGAIKKRDILMMTIAFGDGINDKTKTLLKNCATSPDHYFRATTKQELAEVFEDLTGRFTEQTRLIK